MRSRTMVGLSTLLAIPMVIAPILPAPPWQSSRTSVQMETDSAITTEQTAASQTDCESGTGIEERAPSAGLTPAPEALARLMTSRGHEARQIVGSGCEARQNPGG